MHNCTCCFWLQGNVSVIVAWSSLGCHFDLLQKVIPCTMCTSVPQKDDLLANLPHMACLCIARADASMMYIFPNLREFVPIHHLIQVSLLKKVPSQFHALVGPCFKAGILWQIGPAYMACICMVNCQAKCIDDLSPINPVLYFWFIISNMWIHCIDSQFCAHWQAARMHWWFIAWPTLPQRNIGQQRATFHFALQCSFFQFCSTLFLPPSTRQGPILTLKVGWWTRPPSTQITHKYSTAVYPAVFRTAAPCQHFKWDW